MVYASPSVCFGLVAAKTKTTNNHEDGVVARKPRERDGFGNFVTKVEDANDDDLTLQN